MTRDTTFRTLHDIGLAAWFGGSLFGLTGLNTAAEEASDQRTTARISAVGWAKWSPVNTAAVGVHLVGAGGLLLANRKRALLQKGATGTAATKLGITAAAIGASVYARLLGKKIEDLVVHQSPAMSSSVTSHASSGTTQAGEGSATQQADKVAGQAMSDAAERLPVGARQAQQQLSYLQVAIPVLTGALVVLTSRAGEEQRPSEQFLGIARRAGSAVGLDV